MKIAIKGFAFAPAAVTVGTTVVWTRDASTVHTVTDEGAFDSGSLAQGRTCTRIFATPGVFSYICAIHPYMKAAVTVVPSRRQPGRSHPQRMAGSSVWSVGEQSWQAPPG